MKEITWSRLRLIPLSQILKGECLKVTGDGQLAFYAVIKPEQLMKDRVEGICGIIDAGRERKANTPI